MTLKMVFVPPQSDAVKSWLPRLLDSVPDVSFVAPESMDEARREIADADAAFGTIPPDVLAAAGKLRGYRRRLRPLRRVTTTRN